MAHLLWCELGWWRAGRTSLGKGIWERGKDHWNWRDEEFKNVIPAEGILLCDAIVDVADQEGSLGFVEEIFKVMDNRGEGLVTWSVDEYDI